MKMKYTIRRRRWGSRILAGVAGILCVTIVVMFGAGEIMTRVSSMKKASVCDLLDCGKVEAKMIEKEEREAAERKRLAEIKQTGRIIYLTFDDGPSEYTAELLDILARYRVKATFFVTGYGDDGLIRRMFDEGHAIGIHTASHNYSYIYSNRENFWADSAEVSERIFRITGARTNLMRFAGGSSNTVSRLYDAGSRIMSQLVTDAGARGLYYFDWNVDSGDAEGFTTADEVFGRVAGTLKNDGPSVVLQHDTKKFSVEAVPKIIEYGLAQGYVFEKLDAESFSARHGVNN